MITCRVVRVHIVCVLFNCLSFLLVGRRQVRSSGVVMVSSFLSVLLWCNFVYLVLVFHHILLCCRGLFCCRCVNSIDGCVEQIPWACCFVECIQVCVCVLNVYSFELQFFKPLINRWIEDSRDGERKQRLHDITEGVRPFS